jgi:thymidylate kinase
MILIFEGADLVGKSTLADRFAAQHGWPVVKIRWALVGDERAETVGIATATIQLLRTLRPDVILDRCYFSMWAYGEQTAYLPELIARFDRVSGNTDARLVLLTASSEELRRRYEREPDLYFTLEKIQAANARFPALLPLLPVSLPYLHLDTTNLSPDDAFDQVEAFVADPRRST